MKLNSIWSILLFCLCLSGLSAQSTFKLDSIYQYSWNESLNDWRHDIIDIYMYGNEGSEETNLLRLSSDGEDWIKFYQYNNSYNGNNDLVESIQQTWDGSNWQNASRDTYQYDEENNKTTFTYAINSNGSWLTFNESFYSYNSQNNITEDYSTMYDYVAMSMVNFSRISYTYNNNLLDYEITEEWQKSPGSWENSERVEYTYNVDDYPSLIQTRAWGVSSGEWSSPYRQNMFTYNADNLIIEVVEQVKASEEWQNTAKTINTYDVNNNILEILSQEWNSANSVWENVGRQLRTFDGNNNEVELIYQTWESANSTWQGFLRLVKYWSPEGTLSANFEDPFDGKLTVYPNPASEMVFLKSPANIESVALYDIQGKEVIKLFGVNSIDLTDFEAGFYLLNVFTDKGKTVKKLILK